MRRGSALEVTPKAVEEWPLVTVVVPTYNEGDRVRTKIANLLEQDYPIDRLEIVVVDNSSDGTPGIVAEMRDRHPKIIKFMHLPERKGLAVALDLGYRNARGTIVVKSDCDSRLVRMDSLKSAVSYLGLPEVGSVTGAYAAIEEVETGYRSVLHRFQVAESNLDSTPIAHGAFLAFKKSLYRGIDPNSLADDTEIALDIRKQGYRTLLIPGIVSIEDHPFGTITAIKQRSRRARGILRLYTVSARTMIFNSRFGRYGMVVVPLEIALMAVVPLAFLGVCLVTLFLVGTHLGIATAAALAILGIATIAVLARNSGALYGLLIAEVSGVAGLLLLLFPQSGIYEKTRD